MLPSPAEGFAVVSVQTTGLDARRDRIVRLAVATTDPAGRVQDTWSTLVDPGRDPGPVALHGLTSDRLADAPGFAEVEATAAGMLRGRVLVAHDASFGWRVLAAETARASGAVRVSRRLCTMALARRLELDLPDLTLASLAARCGAQQPRPHDAVAEVRALVEVLHALLPQADELGAQLPLAACAPDDRRADGLAPRVRSPWADPGPWRPDLPLVQGARFAVTGPTGTPRPELYDRALVAGLVPMNSVSGRTRLLISNNPSATTADARAAAAHGIPTVTEGAFLRLLGDVRPGVPAKAVAVPVAAGRGGPLAGVRVLVLGGP
ncbi:exonuclease domain-containing protein, partial [Pseudonocardia lacus]|uniref:exonuclease domain-containing protein n=1 Tax=Pseudonocardia lacus TaxID=2835865 RepID=UPI002E1EE678